jgi:alkanesulfonate monooxygenase
MSSVGEKLRGATARAAQSGIPDFDAYVEFCRQAEECGIESLLTAFGFHRPDPIVMAAALGMMTTRIKFMVAVRSGIMSPTAFVQQVNSVSALTNGRICLNVVAGHTPREQAFYGDFLSHDERYDRTDEFLTVCRAFWQGDGDVNFTGEYYRIENGRLNTPFVAPDRTSPEIFLGGGSTQAEALAIKHADCWWRLPDSPERLGPRIRPILEAGTEVGLLISLLARPTREQALRDAYAMIESLGSAPRKTHKEFEQKSDSVAFKSSFALAEATESDWLTPTLWTGAVPLLGAVALALVGSADEVADAMIEYKQIGVSQFLLMGWPDLEEMTFFARAVLPRVRERENFGF